MVVLPWLPAKQEVLACSGCAVLCCVSVPAAAQADVELPPGAADRVHVYFTEGSCMTITPLAAPPETVTVQGDTVTPQGGKQHTKVGHGGVSTVVGAKVAAVLRMARCIVLCCAAPCL